LHVWGVTLLYISIPWCGALTHIAKKSCLTKPKAKRIDADRSGLTL